MVSMVRNPMTGLMDSIGVRVVYFKDAPRGTDSGYQIGTIGQNLSTLDFYMIRDNTYKNAVWEKLSPEKLDFYDSVLSIADASLAPPTTSFNDRYILDNSMPVHADWDGALSYDVVYYNSVQWVSSTPTAGAFCYVEDETTLYVFDSSWQKITAAIPDATTTTKGIASFESADFNVVSGHVSLVSPFYWNTVTGTTQALAVSNGYTMDNVALVTGTLPTTASAGDIIKVDGKGAGLWKIAQNASQTIHFLGTDTTTGVTGSLTAKNRYDCVTLRCITDDTDFVVEAVTGNLTIA